MPSPSRRSLSQRNLDSRHQGPLGEILALALQVPPRGGYALTHGFHPYPGRFHPHLPRTVLAEVAHKGERVFDPIMGGGTTLVEGVLLGLHLTGNDLNPIAGLVARERTRPRTPAQAAALQREAEGISGRVEALRGERNPPRVFLPRMARCTPHYQRHLLAELMQWIRLINETRAEDARETLRAIFSSAVVKFSNRAADSATTVAPPRYPKGAASRFLVAKCAELTRAQAELGRRLATPWPEVRLSREDARLLPSYGWGEFDHILTSPPYPGTYDYLEHHRLRLDWLDLPDEPLAVGEIGARRGKEGPSRSTDYRDLLVALGRVLRPEGNLFAVIGDWLEQDHAVDGARAIARLAEEKGWRLASQASARREPHRPQERRAFAKRGKWEHLLHFRRE